MKGCNMISCRKTNSHLAHNNNSLSHTFALVDTLLTNVPCGLPNLFAKGTARLQILIGTYKHMHIYMYVSCLQPLLAKAFISFKN